MDRVPRLVDSFEENPRVDGGACNGSTSVEIVDESIVHLTMPDQEVDRLSPGTSDRQSVQTLRQLGQVSHAWGQPNPPPDDDDQEANQETLTLAGRPDIDAAMVQALGSTIVAASSSQVPGEATRDRDQLALVDPFGSQGASTWGSPVLAGRPDIDAAMILALRSAILAKNNPIPDHLAPGRNQVGTAIPAGER